MEVTEADKKKLTSVVAMKMAANRAKIEGVTK
jgi:hypothetical protein